MKKIVGLEYYRKNKVSIISMLIVGVFLFLYMVIVGIEPFGTYSFVSNDCLQLIYPFLISFRRKLLSGDSLLYYWNNSLGDNYLPSYFYNISSPLYYLVVFVKSNNVRDFLNFTILIRIVISAGTFGFYLSRRSTEESNYIFLVSLSCIYALSGFIVGYCNQCMWLDSYALLPIIMFGYERLIKEKKPAVYIFSLVLCAFCNFFIVYMIGIFLVLWFLLDEHGSVTSFFKDLSCFLFSSFIAIGISAIPIIVSLYSLMDTRVSASAAINHEWFGSIFEMIRNMFFLSSPVVMNYSNNSANLYAGTISIIFVFLYFISDRVSVSEKIRKGLLIGILYISMNESILNYIWHGFHYQIGAPNRFSFFLIFIFLLIASESLDNLGNPKLCLTAIALAVSLPMITYFFVDLNSIIDDNKALIFNIVILLIFGFLVLLYSNIRKKAVLIILCTLIISETLLQSAITLKYASCDLANYDEVMNSFEIYKDDKLDNTFIRTVMINGVNENDGLLYDLKGISSFNGFMKSDVQAFLNAVGYQNATNVIDEKGGGYPLLYDIFGVKEICCTDDISIKCFDIPVVYQDDFLNVYENPDALSLGFGIIKQDDDFILYDENRFNNLNNLIYHLSGDNDIVQEIYPEYSLSGNIEASFITDRSGYYNMSIKYDDFVYVTLYVNDHAIRREYIQSTAVISLGYIDEGSKVVIEIDPVGYNTSINDSQENQILDLHMSVIDKDDYRGFIDSISKNQMQIKFYKTNHFSADIKLDDDQVLFTSIPFDEGWHIYENGKELNKQKFANTFILLDIGSGYHELEFKYIPKGLYLSVIITIISLLFFTVYMVLYRYKKKKD